MSRDDLDGDIEDEFRLHLELLTEENIARGMAPDLALQEAERRMGDMDRWKAEMKRTEMRIREGKRRRERMEFVLRETGQAARSLLRRPGFSGIVLLTLTLGMGATTAGFTVLDAVALRPLPYADSRRLVWIDSPVPAQGQDVAWGLSVAGYFQFQDGAGTLEALGGFARASVSLTGELGAYQVRGASVQAELLDALSARPALGRLIESEDDDPDAGRRVLVLGYDFWLREFGGDPGILGRLVRIEDEPSEIVGVMARGFMLPDGDVDVWMPLYLDRAQTPVNHHWLSAIGRLAPGETVTRAQAELDRITRRFPDLFPEAYSPGFMEEYGFRTRVRALKDHVIGPELRRSLWIVMGAVSLVLIIACANVANLLLVRNEGRRRELAVRAALGAGGFQLAVYSIAESLLLTVAGAAVGSVAAEGVLQLLLAMVPAGLPRGSEVFVGWQSGVFAVALALVLGFGFGLLPLGRDFMRFGALREGGRGLTAGRSRHRVRRAVVVSQVALAVVLLAGAGLLLRSFQQLRNVDPGFEPENAVAFQLSMRRPRYRDPAGAAAFLREVTERVESLPGVSSVGAGESLPLEAAGCAPVQGEDQAPDPGGVPPCTEKQQVSPGFFAALGVELRGRSPTWQALESGFGEAVVTATLAERLWPGMDPVGRGIRSSGSGWYHVVGVTEALRTRGIDSAPNEAVFFPMVPIEGAPLWGPMTAPTIVVRTAGEPQMGILVPAIRRTLEELDPTVPLGAVETLERSVADSPGMARRSFMMTLMGVAGGMALLLSVVGIYGIISFVVGQRTGEIGLRLALGARVGQVAGLVLRDSLEMTGAGVAIGLLGALFLTRTLESVLFQVSAADPLTLGTVAIVLLVLSLAATWIPARRAMGIDPAEALQVE
jgi:predicted permease